MKYVVVFVVGIGVGVFASWYGFNNLVHTAKKGADNAVQLAKEKEYDSCVEDFYSETVCRQREPEKVCDARILQRCGEDPRNTAEKE